MAIGGWARLAGLAVLLLGPFGSAKASAQPAGAAMPGGPNVAGRVVEAGSGAPIAGARAALVSAADAPLTVSGDDGSFLLALPSGDHRLSITADGFQPSFVDVRANDDLATLVVRLDRAYWRIEEHVVVAGARQERPAADLPRAVSVIDRATLDDHAPRSTPEALADAPGVLLQKTNHGSGSPYVRGLVGNQVLVLVDGVRLNNSTYRYGPNQYLATVDPASVERIEVLRGAGSVLYGSDAIGGVINVVTRRAQLSDGPTRVSGSVAGKAMTSAMERSGRADLSISAVAAAVRGGLSLRHFGDLVAGGPLGVERPSGYHEASGDVSGILRLGRTSLLTASYQHLQQTDVPRFDQVAQRGYARYAFDPQVRQLATSVWRVFPASGPLARVEAGLSWHRSRERRERRAGGSSTLVVEQDIVRTWGFTLDAEMRPVAGWTVAAGLDAYDDSVRSWRRDEDTVTGTALALRGLYPDGASARSLAGFVSASWSGRRLHVDVGARRSRFGVSASDAGFGEIDLSFPATVGSVAGRFALSPRLELVGSLSQAFRAPNVDDVSTLGAFDYGVEVPSLDLAPERALGAEAGVRATAAPGAFALTAFRTNLRDLIDRVESTHLGSATWEGQRVYRKANVAEAWVQGVEVEAAWRLAERVRLAGHATYTYGQQASTGQPMRRIPPLNGLASLRWDVRPGMWLEGQVRAAGAQRRLAPGDVADHRIAPGGTPGWTTLDVFAGRAFGPRLEVRVGFVNLLDEAYRIHGSGLDGAGRSAWLSLRAGF